MNKNLSNVADENCLTLKGAVSRCISIVSTVEGTGYESWRTSKNDNKAVAIYVGRATTLHNHLFYFDTSS